MSIHNVISKFKFEVDYYYCKYEITNISAFPQPCWNLSLTLHNINSRYKLPTVTCAYSTRIIH